jgi:CBS domain-containing protein
MPRPTERDIVVPYIADVCGVESGALPEPQSAGGGADVPPLTAGAIMTSPVRTVPEGTTLREVVALFSEVGVSGFPVVDPAGGVVGIVSERDVLNHTQAHVALARTAFYEPGVGVPEEDLHGAYGRWLDVPVTGVMTYPVVSATEDDTVSHLADLMVSHRLNRVPILRGGEVIGIVAREDVLRAMSRTGGA